MNEPEKNTLILEADKLNLKSGMQDLLKEISFKTYAGECWAITGPSGSGKTLLAKIISGHLSPTSGSITLYMPASSRKILITQQHDFRDQSSRSYYQQRFDSNYGGEAVSVREELYKLKKLSGTTQGPEFEKSFTATTAMLRIDHLLDRRLIELSNGEGKRVQIARALLQKPQMIVFDNPFLGLDTASRAQLHTIIDQLIESGIICFIITSPDEVPDKVTHVMLLDKGRVRQVFSRKEFIASVSASLTGQTMDHSEKLRLLEAIPLPDKEHFSVAVEMRHVNISYGEKKILENITWKVCRGERWALLGPNGAGKSTLLSLINGDNPQAYGNDIWLFDQKKGSGESIWDIKRKIGYISPELHIFFQRSPSYTEALSMNEGIQTAPLQTFQGTTAYEAIASGFNDQVGSSRQITSLQKKQVEQWLELLNISGVKNHPLSSISLGAQRLVLLARALVKNPPLLILDEPCQGLDKEQTGHFKEVVDLVCDHFSQTLIYVSHYREDIPASVSKFLILEKGKVKEEIHR